ncbi:hypothetical protein AB0O76_38605 [Streptomyces sp. NPDC086554]|uniref:hypothetical protein n=1 Tax=Streptomyces sp. NPDC086554 TaxID=3154864 RepID=UPI0034491606
MILRDYDHHGRTWELNPRTGLLSPASGRCHGFVHVGADAATALYADTETLWLQHGQHRWDCATVTVHQSTQAHGTRLFTVEDAQGTALELPYPAPDSGPFDPTYDWIDAESDDFYLWAAGRLADGDATSYTTLFTHFRAGFLPS